MKNIILEIKNLIGAHTETELVNQMTDLNSKRRQIQKIGEIETF